MASGSAISDDDDINDADLLSANVGDVKKINNRVDSTQTQWVCSLSVPDYLLRGWSLPSFTASIAAFINVVDMDGADSQSANAGDVEKINNRVDSTQTQCVCAQSVPD